MEKVGEAEGIKFSYGGTVSNTLHSHCLVKIAQQQGKEDAVMEEIFKNYFEREKMGGDMIFWSSNKADCENGFLTYLSIYAMVDIL